MPSHFCGVYGIKPSYGRVPNGPISNNDQTSHNGPMTRTVADAALMLKVMAGPAPLDQYSLEAPPADYPALLSGDLKGLRVAYSPDLGHARVDPEIVDLVKNAVAAFETLGADVEEVTPAWGPDGPDLIRFFWAAHELAYVKLLDRWEAKMDPGLVACIRSAENHSVQTYLEYRQRKLAYVGAIHRWFQDWDLLLTPAVSVAAFPADRLQPEHWPEHPWDWVSWAEFSYPFNMSHNPAASIPCGFTTDGLPVGLQIVGRRLDDLGVLRASAAFEAARPWADKRPPV
jgi:aspartyl-tRNA(Asn)/glutamyl-tRNA(Gln) amidotransferase subunit A